MVPNEVVRFALGPGEPGVKFVELVTLCEMHFAPAPVEWGDRRIDDVCTVAKVRLGMDRTRRTGDMLGTECIPTRIDVFVAVMLVFGENEVARTAGGEAGSEKEEKEECTHRHTVLS